MWLDHISFECADYKASVAFYQALIGWTPGADEGSQNEVQIGDIGGAIIRGTNMSPIAVEARAKAAADAAAPAPHRPAVAAAPRGRATASATSRSVFHPGMPTP